MNLMRINVKRFRYPDGRSLCPQCRDAIMAQAKAVSPNGRVELDGDHPDTAALWRRIVECKETTTETKPSPSSLRRLCTARVTEWKAARGDERWEALRQLRVPGRGWTIDMNDDRVKAFLAEEGDAAKLLLSKCP